VVARADPFFRAVVAAGLAHGALIASMLRSIPPENETFSRARLQVPASELIDIDIPSTEQVSTESLGAPEVVAHDGASLHTRSRSALARRSSSSFRNDVPFREDEGAAESANAPSAAEAARSGSASKVPVEPHSLSLDQLGLEGPNRLALRTWQRVEAASMRRAASAEGVQSADRIVQSMRQLAWEHDRKIGLGSGGPVAAALEKAAYESNATLEGQATFEVLVIGNIVSAISLVASGSQHKNTWNDVANNALAQLAGRRVRAPHGSRGVVLHIQVASRAALPSGHDPGVEISVGPFVVQRGQGKRSARLAFLVPDPGLTSAIDMRGAAGGLPASGGGVILVRTDIDPVDLGAKARRVVHAHTLEESPLD
jgi:hypothetical protein